MQITTKKEALELLAELMEYFVSTGETVLASHSTGLFTIFVPPDMRENFCGEPDQDGVHNCTADNVMLCRWFVKDPNADGHCFDCCLGECMSPDARKDRDGKGD